MNKEQRLERLEKANKFIEVIAGCGRKFFEHEGNIASLEMSATGRVFFIDEYTGKRIYTHFSYYDWRGFLGGGTLKHLIICLRNYITKGRKLNAKYFLGEDDNGYWSNHPWAYGEDLKKVHAAAIELGIAN